ncbi:ATP-binding protein [Vibrio salinus]|uniref:ATP-binding protein n=1 Tax=Vibrio salinus TaxID=2899784 RepID=UPI001E479992|nr:ATP-binding protein [Vibrio salinus]MCE0492403.1 ATP-binding protein [Vibrio salinus]
MQTLYLIRGLPGSGKSTLAKSMNAKHIEADMFFEKDGEYRFHPELLPRAHQWCQKMTEQYLNDGFDVVVANTFVQYWEMLPYKRLAKRYKVRLVIRVCNKNFGNIHNVPESTITKMRRNWEK